MNKAEIIERYGEAAWAEVLEQRRAYYKAHKEAENARSKKYHKEHKEAENVRTRKYREEHLEQVKETTKKWREEHPEQVKANRTRSSQEQCRKGGKYYEKHLKDQRTGLRGERTKIRKKHAKQYKPYKDHIAPDSQIHHEWIPDTPEYRGVALVEKEQHMHGFVDVIEILDGEITLLTEEEVKRGKKREKESLQTG